MMRSSKPRPLDFVAFGVSVCAITVFSLFVYGDSAADPQVRIHSDGGEAVYSLNSNVDLEIEGPLGITVVSVESGAARVISSPCRDKICIRAGRLKSAGDWTACLPNKVLVRIRGKDEQEIDAITF
jgi:hypothetical protein